MVRTVRENLLCFFIAIGLVLLGGEVRCHNYGERFVLRNMDDISRLEKGSHYQIGDIRIDKEIVQEIIRGSKFQKLFAESPDLSSMTEFEHRILGKDSFPIYFSGEDVPSDSSEICYIMLLHSGASEEVVSLFQKLIEHVKGVNYAIYSHLFKGVKVCFPSSAKIPFRLLGMVSWLVYIERDQTFTAQDVQKDCSWGLSRISQEDKELKYRFEFDATGRGSSIYVIDSGIMSSHVEFRPRGRTKLIFSSFDRSIDEDCDGHGTKVSSIIGGVKTGVAKEAAIYGLQVLDCSGNGRTSDIVSAMNHIISYKQKHDSGSKSIINMSIGGPRSPSIDAAVNVAIEKGFIVVSAAGNEATDACMKSPASNSKVITVAASNLHNERCSFSNYGSCVSVFAPGENVLTASIGAKRNQYVSSSGTSMSAPFVSGVLALLCELYPEQTPEEIRDILFDLTLRGALTDSTLRGSPNVLLQAPRCRESSYSDSKTRIKKENSSAHGLSRVLFLPVFVLNLIFALA